MAAAIVSASMGAIGTLLPKLSALIQGEYKLQKGVKNKIAFLSNELSSMQTLLVKLADNEERLDEQLKDWRNKVRELSYDIEDCIDLFMHKMSRGGAKANLVKKTASKIEKIWSRRKIAKLMDDLKTRVEEESDCRFRYKFDDTDFSRAIQIDPRLPAMFVEAERLVGIDGPREKIIELLKNDDCGQNLKVVSIVGFGGLGKTTLANQIYQKMKGQFDCSCFVPVSRNPNIAKILADMLKELVGHVDPSDNERQVINMLRAFLQHKRYFVVIDDIWSTKAWELVKCALPENNLNSRIITTTRITNVAASCCSSLAEYVHNMQPLDSQQAQQLFSKTVFGNKPACPPHLEEVSHRILEKCHGLPLAIITIASLLAGKSNKVQWEQVYNSINSSHQGMKDILLLSYYDLPYNLKTCLLYLSMYLEDYRINRDELIWRWIAEGFIKKVRGQTVDQVAESYFNELVNRSLIQPLDIQYDGKARACRVHDMVLELIVSLSAEENFACIVEGQSYSGSGHKIRRLSVQTEHVGDEGMQKIIDNWSQVRSISFYGLQGQQSSYLQELRHVRVLSFVYTRGHLGLGNQHIKYIGSLFQLKFLTICSSDVTELPEDIGNLRYLQTLDISGTSVKKLPPSIGHLQKLVRLLVDIGVALPDEIGDLQALQELSFAQIFSTKLVEAVRRLTKLKTLNMYVPDREKLGRDMGRFEDALKSSLAVMGNHGLQSLMIHDSNDMLREEHLDLLCSTAPYLWKLHVNGKGIAHIPKQTASLVNLTHLCLEVLRIKQEDLCIIGGIPALLFCELYILHAPDERLTISSQLFLCLKEFRYNNCYYGGGLEMLFLQEAMPELQRLELQFRVQETESKMGFEFSFEHLASLEHIRVEIRTEDATRSRVEAAEAAVRGAVSMHPGHPTLDMVVPPPPPPMTSIGDERHNSGRGFFVKIMDSSGSRSIGWISADFD